MVQLNENMETGYARHFRDFKAMGRLDQAYIIDNDEIIIHLAGNLIRKSDFCEDTVTFTDGLSALERLREVSSNGGKLPDVILFDLNMPVMDGWEFYEEYLKLPLEMSIPLFVFTSSINPADRDKVNACKEIKGLIEKPLTIHKLDKILRMIS